MVVKAELAAPVFERLHVSLRVVALHLLDKHRVHTLLIEDRVLCKSCFCVKIRWKLDKKLNQHIEKKNLLVSLAKMQNRTNVNT